MVENWEIVFEEYMGEIVGKTGTAAEIRFLSGSDFPRLSWEKRIVLFFQRYGGQGAVARTEQRFGRE